MNMNMRTGIISVLALVCMAMVGSAGCNHLTISAPPDGYSLTDWSFMYQVNENETNMICGNAPNGIIGTPEGMFVQMTVTNITTLSITANVTYTDVVGRNYTRIFRSPVQVYYPGYYGVDLVSEYSYNYQVGEYNVVEVQAIPT